MSDTKRLANRNAAIQEMMLDGKSLKNFYRFTAQNPDISLHDACQIVLNRPNASICFSFEEWNAMGRRVTKGRNGIPYYTNDGERQFVFDANDTHGDKRYKRLIYSMKRLLTGLDVLNGTEFTESIRGDFKKVHSGVATYLLQNDYLKEDEERNKLLIDGITYSLYSKTGFPKENGITIHGLPYDIRENAQLFKEIYRTTTLLQEEVEDAYIRKQEEVKVIDDTEEENISDEPIISTEQEEVISEEHSKKQIVEIHAAINTNYKGYVALVRYLDRSNPYSPEEVYLGKKENYTIGKYDNTDNSLIFLSNNPKMFRFMSGEGWTETQQAMIDKGLFSEQDYKDFYDLQNGPLKELECTQEIKFGIDINKANSGVQFRYPNWQDENKEEPKVTPFYQRYSDIQKEYPQAAVVYRLGDFYEVMGEKAVEVSKLLDLTLTGRDVGLENRVSMCGFPYHVAEKYIKQILSEQSVVVVEDGEEPKYILSHAEVNEETDDYSDEQDEDPEEETEDEEWTDEEIAEALAEEEQEKVTQPQAKGKSIRERKRKEKPQLSLFDLMDGKEEDKKTPQEQLKEWGLKRGSGFEDGKFRIYDEYQTGPSVKEFAYFLNHEYGTGGSSGGGYDTACDGKGFTVAKRDKKHPENDIIVKMNWVDVAYGIADLIDDKNYFSVEEQEEYDRRLALKNEIANAKTDEEKLKVIARQFITKATEKTFNGKGELRPYDFKGNQEFITNHKAELEQILQNEKEIKAVLPPPSGYEYLYKTEIFVEFYPEYCKKLRNDKTPTTKPMSLDDEEDADWDKAIDSGAMKPISRPQENTDLNEIGVDTSEHGGAKSRFIDNLKAIRLVNMIYDEDRNPNIEEKRILSKYVGWGGLAEAFDEHNEKWSKEYNELKQALSFEDYDRAKGSVLNAHYTSKEVIEGMYNALKRFGVKGGNKILEPAMGIGNFFGYMPKEVAEHAKLYGVELDNITGRIAAKLYPNVNVQVKGFEQTSFSNNCFDIMVSNVPFGAYSIYDSEYAKHNFYIHDYFIAKGIDKIKPNGLMAVITSKGTLDKLNPTVRKYIADRAELLGAVRLPNNAFTKTANTQVTTDILFFRKREEKIDANTDNTEWLSMGKTEQGYEINNYYIQHPEMVLGTLAEEHGLYGAIDVTVKPDGRELSNALKEVITHLPKNIYENPQETADAEESKEIEVDYDVKPLCYKTENGKLYMRVGDKMVEQTIPKKPQDAYERLSKMVSLRNELRHILDLQTEGCSDEKLRDEQRMLNANYDQFVKRYGYINNQTNRRLFREDGDSALLLACEKYDEHKKTATKEDIFSKRTIRPYVVPTSTDDCFEALQISKNERGKVDIAYIEELTKKNYNSVLTELGNTVFRNPLTVENGDKYSGFETAEEYLSGNVAKKLHTAKAFAAEFPEEGYEPNVKALEQVQPTRVTASDISVRLGASWVDKSYYKQFFCELLNIPSYYSDGLELYYNAHDSSWRIDKAAFVRNYSYVQIHEVYGTDRANAYRLFEDCLNLKATSIYDTVEEDGRERRVLNQAETIAAREKQNKIKDAFKNWIFAEPERRDELEDRYNALFNQIKLPSYDGSYLKFPEMNPEIELKQHQKDAVNRIITSGNTLLHHVVGSGKTYTICATIMKLRQYGLAQKPMIAVPNHLVQQWADEFRKLYPTANLLIASKEDLEKDNRQRFVSKVAMGDWDAVIIAQSSFAKIPISPERQIAKIREEIGRIETTIEATWDEGSMPRGAIKNLERIKKNREAQLKKLLDDNKKDNILTFEKLGVDYLFVDEAHYYKNLFLFTKMNNVAGISSSASQRASDLQLKCEYINEMQGGDKGVVFATGTPISNSMTEMYTMQTYLQQRTLKEAGITYFDGWAADFGETITSLEMAPSGQGYKAKTRFAKFTNMPELLTFYRSFADVKTADMVKLEVPEVDRNVVTLKPSETVIELAEEIAERAEKINDGGVDPHIDNMLKVTSDGKKLALDARCFDSNVEDESGSKVNECAFRVFGIWQESKDTKGTQLIFCDLSTPKMAFEDYEYGKDFDVYNDLKYKIVQMGIPKEEIAFIHDANTDDQKQKLFDNVNEGNVRVLIGSTGKCGAGTNVQKHLVALHHLDTPYRPSDLQQREGRIIRQGNENKNVKIFTYVTERTFDSYSYQILENKQRFISQIDRGDLTAREAEDIDETTLTYAEIKAITAANPKIKRKMEIDTEVARLRVLEGQYKKNLYSLQDKVRKELPDMIHRQELYLERAKEDIQRIKENYNPDSFSISVLGTVYTDKKEGARALYDTLMASTPEKVVAEYCGFKISLNPLIMLTADRSITLAGSGQYSVDIGVSASGNMTRIENFFDDFPNREERLTRKLEQLHKDFETAQEQVKKPFEHQEMLQALISEQTQINAELDLNKREEVIIDEENEEEEVKVTEDTDNYMGLPEQEEPKTPVKRKARKPIREHQIKAVEQEQRKTPDAFVFVVNGDYYDIVGERAEELAKKYDFDTTIDNINGESKTVLSMPFDGFDSLARLITNENGTIKIIESREEKQEVDFIDNEDKVAEMQVDVLPDYSIRQQTMHEYGYTWDGMLPLRRNTAQNLKDIGLQIYMLRADDTEGAVSSEEDFDQHDGLYGIEKPDWNNFIQSEEGRNYLATKFFITMAAKTVATEEMSYMEAMYVEPFIDNASEETDDLRKYLEKEQMPDQSKMMSYTNGLMETLTNRLSGGHLEQYGWTEDDVARSIADKITPEELRKNAQIYIEYRKEMHLQEFVNDGLKQMKFLDGKMENFTEEEMSYIVPALKDHFQDSEWDRSTDEYPYDAWFDDFAEEELPKYISEAPEETETETIENKSEPNYKKEVIESVEEEFEEFKNKMTSLTPEELFYKNYKIHVKTELNEVISTDFEESYLGDDEYKALYEEKGSILQGLYDDFLGSEYASINNYGDTAEFIKDYCWEYHEDIMNPKEEKTVVEEKTIALLYLETFAYAKEHNEVEQYRLSVKDNIECKTAIEKAITDNFDGYHLNKEIEKPLIDTYGAERVIAILANTVKEKYYDGRFSFDNKEWTKDIETFKDENMKMSCVLETHPAVLDGFIDMARDYAEKLEEQNKEEKKMPEQQVAEIKPTKKWVTMTVARDALIHTYENHSFMRMPQGEYGDYTYNVFNDRIKNSTMLTDLQSDSREVAYSISLPEDWIMRLRNRDGDEVELTATEFAKAVNYKDSKEYERNNRVSKQWYSVKLPSEAMRGMYEDSSLFVMPNSGEYKGQSYYLPNAFVKEDTESEGEFLSISIPEDLHITVKNRAEDTEKVMTAEEYVKTVENTKAEQYVYEKTEQTKTPKSDNGWRYVSVNEKAKIAEYEGSTLLKMPNGEYAGYCYYIPNNFLRPNEEKGTIAVSLPPDFEVKLVDKKQNRNAVLTPQKYIEAVKDKGEEEYQTAFNKPSEDKQNRFKCEQALRDNVPEEMKNRPNWCIVRTKLNEESGHVDKFLVDCNTGKFSRSDDPETWTTFENACTYARENGGETLAYALDGKDKIACIDLDNCYDENKNLTPLATSVAQKTGGTYSERSISGNGYHYFGKTDGLNVRTFSKNGDMEFYQKAHFIAMTGDTLEKKELKNFDYLPIRELVLSECDKRTEWSGVGKGVQGLSSMTDRDVVEKAESAKHGDTFKALYSGQDLQNNHSNSDMSLMNRLAFWCNGDKEQMLRIFATSGLYRPDKAPDYYEGTAIKAIKDTTSRFQPQTQVAPKPISSNSSGSGKR